MKLEELTEIDFEILQLNKKENNYFQILLIFFFLFAIMVFYFKQFSYWNFIGILLVFGLCFLTNFRFGSKINREKFKYCGDAQIIKKEYSSDENSYSFILNNSKIKSIFIDQKRYDLFNSGDRIQIEVSAKSKILLKIDKIGV